MRGPGPSPQIGVTSDTEGAGSLRARYRGALLGTGVGDALGMPVEGMRREDIERRHGTLREMLEARLGRGTMTDDTHLAAALARALLDTGGTLDRDRVAERFAEVYDPERGYGGNTRRILASVASGERWTRAVERFRLPGGSWANGAAMRVTPVALASPRQPERVRAAARAQAQVTGHTHPVGRGAAELQALAVRAAVARAVPGEDLEPEGFLTEVREWADEWPTELEESLDWIQAHTDARPEELIRSVGTGARASRSVPAALWAFLSARGRPEETLIRAVNLGGDTDTVGAMAGAIAGAYAGSDALPDRWVEALEEGPHGRSELIRLADRLYEIADAGREPPGGR